MEVLKLNAPKEGSDELFLDFLTMKRGGFLLVGAGRCTQARPLFLLFIYSLIRHHSTSILSQSDPAECGFRLSVYTSCSFSMCYRGVSMLRYHFGDLLRGQFVLLVVPSRFSIIFHTLTFGHAVCNQL